MFANFTQETCTGTGDLLTLTGTTTGNRPFSRGFADGDLVDYAVRDSGGVITCSGIGTYNSAGNTITRNDTENDNGTVTDKAPATNIVLSAGIHTISCDLTQKSILPASARAFDTSGTNRLFDAFDTTESLSDRNLVANRVWGAPYYVAKAVTITALATDIVTLSATTTTQAQLGIYREDSGVFTLLCKSNMLDMSAATGSAGWNHASLIGGDVFLNPGMYWISIGSDADSGDATIRGKNYQWLMHPFTSTANDSNAVGSYGLGNWSGGILQTVTPSSGTYQSGGVYPRLAGVFV